jgi:HSP20 family protein
MEREGQTLPVRLYQTDTHLMLAAPMPGLEPGDISVDISGDAVTIKGVERGVGQHRRDLLIEEWTIGPYERKVSLPQPVDGALTNATYGNGVLVLAMPKMEAGERGVSSTLHLDQVGSARGERVGHAGHDVQPKTSSHRVPTS